MCSGWRYVFSTYILYYRDIPYDTLYNTMYNDITVYFSVGRILFKLCILVTYLNTSNVYKHYV